MARGEGDACGWEQVDERVGGWRDGFVDSVEDLFVLVGPRDGEDIGVVFADVVGFCAQATCDDDLAVFLEGLADGVEGFGLGGVQKAAGVDDDGVCACVIGRDCVAFGAQSGKDAFAIDQCFGAAEGDHADGGLAVAPGLAEAGLRGEVGAEGRWVLFHVGGYRGNARLGETVCVVLGLFCLHLGVWQKGSLMMRRKPRSQPQVP